MVQHSDADVVVEIVVGAVQIGDVAQQPCKQVAAFVAGEVGTILANLAVLFTIGFRFVDASAQRKPQRIAFIYFVRCNRLVVVRGCGGQIVNDPMDSVFILDAVNKLIHLLCGVFPLAAQDLALLVYLHEELIR